MMIVDRPDSRENAPRFSMRDLLRILFRHKGKVFLFVFVTVTAVILRVITMTPVYVSEAKLFVGLGRETMALDPSATTGEIVKLEKSPERELNSAKEILKSRQVLARVIDRLGPEAVLGDSGNSQDGSQFDYALSGWVADQWLAPLRGRWQQLIARVGAFRSTTATSTTSSPVEKTGKNQRERAIDKLQQSIRITSPKLSNIVSVSAEGVSPDSAQQTVTTLTEEFVDEYMRINRTTGSHQFFSQQSSLLRDQLKQAEHALRTAKDRFGMLTVEGNQASLEERIKLVEDRMMQNSTALAAAEAKIAHLEECIAALPPTVETQTLSGIADTARAGMLQRLAELQVREQGLKSQYADSYPVVASVRKQREQLTEALEAQPDSRTHTFKAINPVRQELEVDLLGNRASAASLRANNVALANQLDELTSKRSALNEHAMQVVQMQRKVELLDSSYRKYAESAEQTRISEALTAHRISSINAVQPATRPIYPVAPKKRVAVMLAFIFGSLGGVGLAFSAEHLDRSIKTPEQAALHLGVPVLLAVPYSRRSKHSVHHQLASRSK